MRDDIDNISGRKLVICCDGTSGLSSYTLGLSDECVIHASGIFGAVAAIERNDQTLVPIPEKRVHNISFDLSAYISTAFEENGSSKFALKIFGNSRCRYMALAVNKCNSNVVRALKTVLDKSVRMTFLILLFICRWIYPYFSTVFGHISEVCPPNRISWIFSQ